LVMLVFPQKLAPIGAQIASGIHPNCPRHRASGPLSARLGKFGPLQRGEPLDRSSSQDRLEVKTTRTANQEGQESFFNAKGSWRQGWIAGLTHRNGCQAGEAGRSKACLADYPGNTPGVRYRTNIFGFSWIWQRTSGPASTR
jgi:hypothetical protein